jgi:osmotically-inducible protein OsmY
MTGRLLRVVLPITLVLLAGCDHAERDKARARAEEMARDAKRQAREVASQVKTNAPGEAKEKLRRGGEDLKRAAVIAQVKSKLASELGVDTVTNVSVGLDGSTVTLTGTVHSDQQKRTAEEAARGIAGVSAVQNKLSVSP